MIINIDSTKQQDIPSTDLVIVVGKNNSGKSRLLKKWRGFFAEKSDYIPPNRFDVHERVVEDIGLELKNQRTARTPSHYGPQAKISEFPQPETFLELVNLDNTDRNVLKDWHNKYFDELKIEKENSQNDFSKAVVTINNKKAHLAGSGSRAVLGLLSRLFDPALESIFIDEPEIGLEPRVQKKLFELIKKVSKGEDNLKKKKVILTTHSNLFLDKEDINNNWRMDKVDDTSNDIVFTQINTEAELLNVSFNLLGASPADLFFPNNILIVEGLSDQKFISKILDLKYPKSKISVHFCEGITKIEYAIPAIEQMLKSLTYLSLYKDKICVLVDQDGTPPVLSNWRTYLGDTNNDRVIELGKNGVEYFYPKTILSSLTGIAEGELDTKIQLYLENEKSSHENKADLGSLTQITKVELAEKVTEQITATQLPEIDRKIMDLIDKCFTLKIS